MKWFMLFLLFFATDYSYSQGISSQDFLNRYQQNVGMILNDYPQPRAKKLQAHIFDLNNKFFYDFLTSTKGKKRYENNPLAMMYYDSIEFNDKNTSYCFIMYDSKSNLISNYLKHSQLALKDIVLYLSLHEMGHCLVHHQQEIGIFHAQLSPNEHEQIADMFSIAYFIVHRDDKKALKIIRENKLQDLNDIHHNPVEVQKFYNLFQKRNFSSKLNTQEIFQYVCEDFLKIKSHPVDLISKI